MHPDGIAEQRLTTVRAEGRLGRRALRLGMPLLGLLLAAVGGCDRPSAPPWTQTLVDPIDILTITAAGPNTGANYAQIVGGMGRSVPIALRVRLRVTPIRLELGRITDSLYVKGQFARQPLLQRRAAPQLVVYQSDLGVAPLTLLRHTIGTQTPILLVAGFDGPEEQEHFRALDALPKTARVIRGDLMGTAIMNILRLFPGTKEIVTVSPGGPLAMFDMTRIITRFPDLRFFHLTVASDEKLAEVLDSLPSNAALVTMNLAKNVNSSMRFSFGGTLEPLLPPSRVPIFPLALSQFDGNVVGGPMGNGAAYGRMIGEQVTALLRGADPDTLPVRIYDQWEVRYNWDQLVRYGIPVSALPPHATVVGRASAFWRDYRTIIVSVLVLFAGLVAFLLFSMRQSARIRRSLLADQLRAREQARIQDAERLRIARDLHDSIGQGLSLIALRLDRMQNEGGPPVHSEEARSLLRELRGIVGNLQPMDLRQQPLPDAIRHLLAEVERTTGMVTDLIVHMETLPAWLQLSEPEAAAILRITQEAVHNVITHAEAHRCTVHMERTPGGTLRVCITDDGIGLRQGSEFASGHGLGLASIRGRAASIGWTATISAGPVHGTTVRVEQTCAPVVAGVALVEG